MTTDHWPKPDKSPARRPPPLMDAFHGTGPTDRAAARAPRVEPHQPAVRVVVEGGRRYRAISAHELKADWGERDDWYRPSGGLLPSESHHKPKGHHSDG